MDLSFTAPEDIEMMKVKILNGLLTVDLPLQEIHHIMDGKMWDTDTFQDIAEILTEAGFVIKEPKE